MIKRKAYWYLNVQEQAGRPALSEKVETEQETKSKMKYREGI